MCSFIGRGAASNLARETVGARGREGPGRVVGAGYGRADEGVGVEVVGRRRREVEAREEARKDSVDVVVDFHGREVLVEGLPPGDDGEGALFAAREAERLPRPLGGAVPGVKVVGED